MKDIGRLLPPEWLDVPVWNDLIAAMQQVLGEQAHDVIDKLAVIRRAEELNRELSVLTARTLGFKFDSTLIGDAEYRRLVEFIGLYYDQKASGDFLNFMGWIKNTRFTIRPLWGKRNVKTNEYSQFGYGSVAFTGNTIFDGHMDGWFPTTHVDLTYDQENFPLPSDADLVEMFTKLAPINLVLRYVYPTYPLDSKYLYFVPLFNVVERDRYFSSCFLAYSQIIVLATHETNSDRVFSSTTYVAA